MKPLFRAPVGAALCAALCAASLSALADPDTRLLAAARAAEPAVIQSLKEMVAIESGTMEDAGLLRLADYAEGRLKALGL